jgi:predicted nucleotidyltransferase
MDGQIINDPILNRFRAALAETYGDRLERAVLFGSRARGDSPPDSDYDIAVLLTVQIAAALDEFRLRGR